MTGEISALSSPTFRKYLCGILAANMGFRIQAIALAILVYRTTGSALDLGIVSAIGAVPAVLCTVLGGVLADRYDTRIVWAVNSGLSAALIGLLGWLTFNDALPIGQIYVLAALMGVVAGVNMPLSQSYFPSLVPPSALKSGVTFNSMSMSIASIFGPTLAGLIIAAVGLSAAFTTAALCWSLPVLIAPILPARKAERRQNRRTLADFRLGLSFIRQNSLIPVLAALVVTNYLLIYGWVQTLPAFVELFAGGERDVGYYSRGTPQTRCLLRLSNPRRHCVLRCCGHQSVLRTGVLFRTGTGFSRPRGQWPLFQLLLRRHTGPHPRTHPRSGHGHTFGRLQPQLL